MTRNYEKKYDTDELSLDNVKQKLGYHYASKIASKTRQLNNRQVYDIVRGWIKDPKKINLVLKLAAKVIEEEERVKNENRHLKMSIIK